MATPTFSAWNDFDGNVTLEYVDTDGVTQPLNTGTCTAFIMANADVNAAAPADAPTGTALPTGSGGVWVVKIQGEEFDPDVCDVMFDPEDAEKIPYLHIRNAKNIRRILKCKYVRNPKMAVS